MKEDFLAGFQESPRPEFAAELYRRITQPETSARPYFAIRAALAAAILGIGLAAVFTVSPAARAAVITLIREIDGVDFLETAGYPGERNPSIVEMECTSLEDARAFVPFSLNLPGWLPVGLVREKQVVITRFSEGYSPVTVTWRGTYGGDASAHLDLTIGQTIGAWAVGPESVETIQLKNRTAGLIRGMWNADTAAWDADSKAAGLTLLWTEGDTTYALFSARIVLADLIRIAESIP